MRKVDDQQKLYYRSKQRVFCVNGDWFYQTREGNRGPFDSPEAASRDAQHFLHEMSDIATATELPAEEHAFGHAIISPELPRLP